MFTAGEQAKAAQAKAADPRAVLGHVAHVAAELKAIQAEIANLRAAQDATGGLEALTRRVAAMREAAAAGGGGGGGGDALAPRPVNDPRVAQLLRKRDSAGRKSRLDPRRRPNEPSPREEAGERRARWCSPWETAVFVFLSLFVLWQLAQVWGDEELWNDDDDAEWDDADHDYYG